MKQNKVYILAKIIRSLEATFDTVKFQFTDREDTSSIVIKEARIQLLLFFLFAYWGRGGWEKKPQRSRKNLCIKYEDSFSKNKHNKE